MNLARNAVLIIVPLAVVLAVAAVTYMLVRGDDDAPDLGAIRVEPGRVSCEMFEIARGYRFQTVVVLDLKARESGVEPDGDPTSPDPFVFTNDISGDVEGTTGIYASIIYPEQPFEQEIIVVEDDTYRRLPNEPWEVYEDFTVPYTPGTACNALAPDLFLGDMEGELEIVRGIPAVKYHFDELVTNFAERHASFGPGSDAGNYVKTFAGDIWVAEEGGYILGMDLVGAGQYPNGRVLQIEYKYQLYDVNAKVEVPRPI